MAINRKQAPRGGAQNSKAPLGAPAAQAAQPDDSKASMLGATLGPDEEVTQHDGRRDGRVSAPRAGRTGGMGSRAERPSEGSTRRSGNPLPPEPGRSSKAPSATDGPRKRAAAGSS